MLSIYKVDLIVTLVSPFVYPSNRKKHDVLAFHSACRRAIALYENALQQTIIAGLGLDEVA